MKTLATQAAKKMKKNKIKYWDFQKASLIKACCLKARKKDTQHFLSLKTCLVTIFKKIG